MSKMSLKSQLGCIKTAHELNELKRRHRDQQEWLEEAKLIIKRMPMYVEDGLKCGHKSIMLWQHADIPHRVDDLNTGVAFEIFKLLKKEGLHDRLFIGRGDDHDPRRSLCFKI